jgi:hypothetical protein
MPINNNFKAPKLSRSWENTLSEEEKKISEINQKKWEEFVKKEYNYPFGKTK